MPFLRQGRTSELQESARFAQRGLTMLDSEHRQAKTKMTRKSGVWDSHRKRRVIVALERKSPP
jgi:hypothetical protein